MASKLIPILIKTFNQVSEDCKKSDESVVPLTDVDYYTEQIHCIFEFDYERSRMLAEEMAQASA